VLGSFFVDALYLRVPTEAGIAMEETLTIAERLSSTGWRLALRIS
jgi:hypothetical protein